MLCTTQRRRGHAERTTTSPTLCSMRSWPTLLKGKSQETRDEILLITSALVPLANGAQSLVRTIIEKFETCNDEAPRADADGQPCPAQLSAM
eukprot:1529856-Rhodomonas_salina.3